jgi:hypothetical protein
MGCSKNYIMYWGVFTLIIVPFSHSKVCTNFQKNSHPFYSICIVHKFHGENTTYFLHKRMAFLGFYFGLTILPLLSQDRREKKSQASLVSFPHPALFLITRVKKRQPPIGCPFKEKVFLLWGVVKTIYIMYWGVFTLIIVSPLPFKVCTNFTKVVPTFCILYIVPFSHFRKKFLFVFYSSVVSVTTSAPLWNNASNSSLPIFSFSKRRSADLWSTSLFS